MNKNVKLEARNSRERANLFSIVSFVWVWKFFEIGHQRELEQTDLFPLVYSHSSHLIGDNLDKKWKQEANNCKKKKLKSYPKLWKILGKCFWTEILFIGILQFILEFILTLPQPIILYKLLKYFNGTNSIDKTEAYYWAGLLSFLNIIKSPFFHFSKYIASFIGIKMKISCCSLIYRKVLRTSKSTGTCFRTGQILNLLTNDVNSLEDTFLFFHSIWMSPIVVLVVAYILYREIELPVLTGIGIYVLIIPLQYVIGKVMPKLTMQAASKTDERLQLVNEIIGGMQVIKMYAWEKPFSQLMDKARLQELNSIKRNNFIAATALSFEHVVPRLCIYITISTFASIGNLIAAEKVFMITAFYNNLANTIGLRFPLGLQHLSKALASVKRLQRFMELEEIEEFLHEDSKHFRRTSSLNTISNSFINTVSDKNYNTFFRVQNELTDVRDSQNAVILRNASSKWCPESSAYTLKTINFTAKSNVVTAVIGPVGSGKSSLFHVILKELVLSKGSLQVNGKVIYVSQEPWVFSSSVRQNILFGKSMDKQRYDEIIKVCQLELDFKTFPHKDQTIIGEKGINLSGGQKARISLARAIYADADIYLLDDPLSAIDANVGRSLFEACICQYLKGKTRILITHQIQFLDSVDYVYVLTNGTVQVAGTFQELKSSRMNFLSIFQTLKKNESDKEDRELELLNDSADEHVTSEEERNDVDEHREFGKISKKVYWTYFKSVGNIGFVVLFFFILVMWQLIVSCGDVLLSKWIDAENVVSASINNSKLNSEMEQRQLYFYVYSALIAGTILSTYFKLYFYFNMCLRSSRTLHFNMFYNIIRATMAFFHNNSSGRIINRFSEDIGQIDKCLPFSLNNVLEALCYFLAVMTMTLCINFWMLIPTIIIGTIFYILRSIYIKTSRSVKRLQGITRSPVVSHLSDTLQGLTTIRSFKAQELLAEEFDNYQDVYSASCYLSISCSTAFSYYLELISGSYIAAVIFSFLLMLNRESVGNVGLVITQTITLAGWIQWGLFQATEVEIEMTAVERIIEYINVTREPCLQSPLENKPRDNCPSKGQVEFKNVSLKYSEKGDLVLRNLNFVVKPTEKVGIVGRTGSGKSSLINALFRMSHIEGEVYIDEVATSKLGLHDLRSKISIIPQEPFLFSGTLRENLDPFQEFTDDKLWKVLDEVQLKKDVVESGLSGMVSDGGSNFSIGQRQLLCLARAVLKQNNVLVMDEATANIDPQTDVLIQKTIKKRFENCTVFIIAHRLNTVIDCDKFIVMDAGQIVEFDHPHLLLQNRKGYLYNMVQKTGPEMATVLSEIAEASYHTVRINQTNL